jgi:CheY-specific phosphatase CheX
MDCHGVGMSNVVPAGAIMAMQDLGKGLESAVAEVFSTMCNFQPVIVSCNESIVNPGVSAIIGFGGKVSGLIMFHISSKDACLLASMLMGMSFDDVDEIVMDAMGETVNMFAGGLKRHISRSEEMFKISIPSVICGNDYLTYVPKYSQKHVLAVQAGPCSFRVQMIVETCRMS